MTILGYSPIVIIGVLAVIALFVVAGRWSREIDRSFADAALIVLFGAMAAVWWFGIYDTAQGRCEREDLGACFVWDMQRSAR